MSKKIVGVVALAGLIGLSVFLVNCGSSSSRPSGVLYALTQGSNSSGPTGYGDNVTSFAVDLDTGSLSLVNSNASTCPTAASQSNPEPCGLPLDILLDPAGANAYILNQGTPCPEVQPSPTTWQCGQGTPIPPTIYPYTVNSDGSLSAPGTAVTWTCGANASSCPYNDPAVAMVRDPAGQFLFVIDSGSYPSPGTTNTSNPSVYPTCPHAPTGPFDVCPSITVFSISKSGGLSLVTQNQPQISTAGPWYLSKIPTGLSAVTFTPPGSSTSQEFLFVTNNLDICTANCVLPQHSDNTVSVFTVNSSGLLTEQDTSPYIVSAVNPVSVFAVNTLNSQENSGGVFVYVGSSSQVGGDINPFQLCTSLGSGSCSAQQVQSNLLIPVAQQCSEPPCNNVSPSSAGENPIQMVADPTNNFLYVASEGSNQVFGFKINQQVGTLTALAPANQPTGSQPISLALHGSVNNTGQYLFVSNSGSSNITGFTLSTTTGTMSNPISVIAPAAPSGIAVH